MGDLISRAEAAKRLQAVAVRRAGTPAGDALAFAAKIVLGVPAAKSGESKRIAQLEQELAAAMSDIPKSCRTCKHDFTSRGNNACKQCVREGYATGTRPRWEWRGVKP